MHWFGWSKSTSFKSWRGQDHCEYSNQAFTTLYWKEIKSSTDIGHTLEGLDYKETSVWKLWFHYWLKCIYSSSQFNFLKCFSKNKYAVKCSARLELSVLAMWLFWIGVECRLWIRLRTWPWIYSGNILSRYTQSSH